MTIRPGNIVKCVATVTITNGDRHPEILTQGKNYEVLWAGRDVLSRWIRVKNNFGTIQEFTKNKFVLVLDEDGLPKRWKNE